MKNGIILDGFPRTVTQAEELDKILKEQDRKVDMVINLTTPKEEIIERILNRKVCSNQDCKTIYNLVLNPPKQEGICDKCNSELILRDDDKPETVKNRLDVYHKQTQPLIDFYSEKGVLKSVDGTVDMKDVFSAIVDILA